MSIFVLTPPVNKTSRAFNSAVFVATEGGTSHVKVDQLTNQNLGRNKAELPTMLLETTRPGQSLGASFSVVNSGNTLAHFTNNFFLVGINYQKQEKSQINETLGTPSISFFGKTVEVYQFQLQFLEASTLEDTGVMGSVAGGTSARWASAFKQYYENHLRGSQLVKNNQKALLKVDEHLIYGYPLNFSIARQANADNLVSGSMTFVVTDYQFIGSTAQSQAEESLEAQYSTEQLFRRSNLQNALDEWTEAWTEFTSAGGNYLEGIYNSSASPSFAQVADPSPPLTDEQKMQREAAATKLVNLAENIFTFTSPPVPSPLTAGDKAYLYYKVFYYHTRVLTTTALFNQSL